VDSPLDVALAAEIDAAYAAYDAHPLDEDDDWGGLASSGTSPTRRDRCGAAFWPETLLAVAPLAGVVE
jgi:hypothetical protein